MVTSISDRQPFGHGFAAGVLGILVLLLFAPERGLPAQSGTSAPADSVQSPRLRALAGEIQRGNADALSNFWKDIQGKAPLVEDIPGHADLRRVTFVVRSKDTNALMLIGPMLPPLRRHPYQFHRKSMWGPNLWPRESL